LTAFSCPALPPETHTARRGPRSNKTERARQSIHWPPSRSRTTVDGAMELRPPRPLRVLAGMEKPGKLVRVRKATETNVAVEVRHGGSGEGADHPR